LLVWEKAHILLLIFVATCLSAFQVVGQLQAQPARESTVQGKISKLSSLLQFGEDAWMQLSFYV
jgi:hypothetical protein